jgi:predicted metal-binding membrane protein
MCWGWIIAMSRDMYGPMTGWSAWMMAGSWDAPHVLLLWTMWAVMMAGMMLPSAIPLLLLYMRSGRTREGDGRILWRVASLTAGYLLVWAVFSIAATGLQRILAEQLLLSPMMEPATRRVGALLLVVAGIYQMTPFKRACLIVCRSPLAFLMGNWRSGPRGALQMGWKHGAYCLGCCWALMLLLFAGGVMNLVVIVALTLWIMAEKILPFGDKGAVASGILLVATGLWLLTG